MSRAERRKNPDYRIAELEAELERLREEQQEDLRISIVRTQERDRADHAADIWAKQVSVLQAEAERLREENALLAECFDKDDVKELVRLHRIEEAARRSTGPGWLENLRAALEEE